MPPVGLAADLAYSRCSAWHGPDTQQVLSMAWTWHTAGAQRGAVLTVAVLLPSGEE